MLIREKDGKPFTGRIHSESGSTLSVYTYKDGLLDGLDVVYYNGAVKGKLVSGKRGSRTASLLSTPQKEFWWIMQNFRDGERHGLTRQYDAKNRENDL